MCWFPQYARVKSGAACPRCRLAEALPQLIILGCLKHQREPPPLLLCSSRPPRARARGAAESTRLLLEGVTARAPTPRLSLSLSAASLPPSLSLFSAAPSATAPPPTVDKDGGRRSQGAQNPTEEDRSGEPADSPGLII